MAVRLTLNDPLSPVLDRGFLEQVLRRHFPSLLQIEFRDLLGSFYPRPVNLIVNGAVVEPEPPIPGDRAELLLRLGRRRKPVAVGWLVATDQPLPEELHGIAVTTLGKVIRRGWDWVGLRPAQGDRITPA
jgi:hypothetical protein